MRDEDIRCLLSFVAHFDWLSPHNRSTFQRCLHTYVNLSSGCNTFMSRLAQSQPCTHLNVQKCDRRYSLYVVVCCKLRLTVSTQSQHFSTMFAYLCKLVEWMQHFYELVCPESSWHTFECTEMRSKTFVVCCRLLHTSIDCLHTITALFNDVCIPM